MDAVIVLVLAFAGLYRLRLARRIQGTAIADARHGRWIVAFNRWLGLALIAAALLWLWWRR
jgi:hypothetical protein